MNQRLLPANPKLWQHHPTQSVRSGESRLREPLPQDDKLSPKRHVFLEQISARAKDQPGSKADRYFGEGKVIRGLRKYNPAR
jgi:hypothetical protein